MKKNNYYQIAITLLLTLNLSSCYYNTNKHHTAKTHTKNKLSKANHHPKLNPEKALQALKAIKPHNKSPLDNNHDFTQQKPTQAGNLLYLWRQSRTNNLELWRSNGHHKGTKRLLNWSLDEESLKNAEIDIPKLLAVNDSHILFWQTVHNPHPKDAKAYLYISDGSINGTKRIHAFSDEDFGNNSYIASPFHSASHGSQQYWIIDKWVYFLVHKTLWRSHIITHKTEALDDLSSYRVHELAG